MTDKNKYIADLRKQVADAAKTHESNKKNFLKASKTEEITDYLSSSAQLDDEESIAKAEKVLKDEKNPVGLRSLAMHRLTNAMAHREDLMTYAIKKIGDTSAPPDLRKACWNAVIANSFSSPYFMAKQPELNAALKGIAEDKHYEMRERAISYLAQNKDEYIHRKLIDGIKDPAKALVSEEKAINLLGYDIHAGIYPVLKNVIEKSSNSDARVEAIHLIGNDPGSKELLTKVFNNKRERYDVRAGCATALKTYHPDEYVKVAKTCVLDEKENDNIRAVCLNGLAHSGNANAYKDAKLMKRVKELHKDDSVPGLQSASQHYLANAKK